MLLLFDIDGTLTRGGPAKEAFQLGLETVFGTAGPIDDLDFSGKTDPQIARELMTRTGMGGKELEAGLEALWTAYLEELARRLPAEPVEVLPGIGELIPQLHERDGVWLGLVTGNHERGARLKLGSAGLSDFFPVGGFGSDHEERGRLPVFAIDRAARHWSRPFEATETVVIGDTPRDVACGKAVGACTVAVATGRFSMSELALESPDLVLPDLRRPEETMDRIRELLP